MPRHEAAPNPQGTAVDRAVRLFKFLARSQQLKADPPRTTSKYDTVLWFAALPAHPAVNAAHRDETPESGSALLSVDRVPHQEPPAPPADLEPWLDREWQNPNDPPRLRESTGEEDQLVALDDVPEIRALHTEWAAGWSQWAEREKTDQPARNLYNELFSAYVNAAGHPEELELVVGAGCLAWAPPGHHTVNRHLVTVPAVVNFDDSTGQLTVHQTGTTDGLTVEVDMIDPGLVANGQHVTQLTNEAAELTVAVLDRSTVGDLLRRLVHALDSDAAYIDEDEQQKPSTHAVAAFAPAIILRRRSRQGIVDILGSIAHQIEDSGLVPDGLLPLVDPDHRPAGERSPEPGALIELDTDPFLPLPVNERQLRVLTQVDAKAQTLVQGPPGTGKTHTVAALLSHLLAQGKRVLVTAHTDRALKEVRAKLPTAIAPLAVSVVGTSRSDLADLKVAVERISYMSTEHDAEATRRGIVDHLAAIDGLQRQRAGLHRRLLDARGLEVTDHEIGDYRGTLAAIAQRVEAERGRFDWISDLTAATGTEPPPVAAHDIVAWHRSLIDDALNADEADARLRLLSLDAVPAPEAFLALVTAERQAISAEQSLAGLKRHNAFEAVLRLDQPTRTMLRQRLNDFAREAGELARRREQWMNDALSDVLSGRASIWQSRADQIAQLIATVSPLVQQLGALTEVVVTGGEPGPLAGMAQALREHIGVGGLKTNPDGSPKVGAFAPKAVKQAQPLFQAVRVNGIPPTTTQQLDAFLVWTDASRMLGALDRAWPDGVRIPPEDTLGERLQWHATELSQLRRVLTLGAALEAEERGLAAIGLPRPNWTDFDAVQTYARLVDAAETFDARAAASEPLSAVEQSIAEVAQWADAALCVQHLQVAAESRDHESYAAAHQRLVRLTDVARLTRRRDEIAAELIKSLPRVHEAVSIDPRAAKWTELLAEWDAAWAWAVARVWVLSRGAEDVNALQAEVLRIEGRVRHRVEQLAAARAWGHAVSAERLSGKARADLNQYAQLVRRLGKGTGIYADQRRGEIKAAMDRCRPAVPVWIMPVYRIAEQFRRVQPDMFDVVIVDEASQAGLEATFLQYIAPKIVVIGDDRQVSPSAVGTDQQQLRDLAQQFLWDDPYRASWQDPKRSLFDEAKMRFEGMITLVEHRRCVPEIIGFSNRIAYEPDGVPLVPVRQYGADRLEPIKPVFLDNGHERGVTEKVNPVEADAIVEQIEKCVADPRYDGLTFGVVSLLGRAQAKRIEKLLLERIPPEEWRARELRCGDSADFQGSERDVMFLSMVKAPDPEHRITALTQDMYVQRFNVAASRAKDQMWVFHSLRREELGNPDDMRFQLLDYCYDLSGRANGTEAGSTQAVPEDSKVEPFDSLFEQRVFNQLVDRGYRVAPQFRTEGYRIDMVVVGGKARLAVECDGDAWHGPDEYERDLARQRDLERCGWRFFRIRESEFYVDRPTVLDRLWNALLDMDIHPSGWVAEEVGPAAEIPPPVIEPEVVPEPQPLAEPEYEPVAEVEPVAVAEVPVVDEPVVEQLTDVEVSLWPPAAGDVMLAEYGQFDGQVIQVATASRREIMDGLLRLVEAEGPVLGNRLHTAYVRASGLIRVTKLVAGELNKAISQAVREGLLVEDNPLAENELKQRTYRLPDQPQVRTRRLGPRSFDEVPPLELVALLDHVGERAEVGAQRAVLELLGLKRLTDNVRSRFAAVEAIRR